MKQSKKSNRTAKVQKAASAKRERKAAGKIVESLVEKKKGKSTRPVKEAKQDVDSVSTKDVPEKKSKQQSTSKLPKSATRTTSNKKKVEQSSKNIDKSSSPKPPKSNESISKTSDKTAKTQEVDAAKKSRAKQPKVQEPQTTAVTKKAKKTEASSVIGSSSTNQTDADNGVYFHEEAKDVVKKNKGERKTVLPPKNNNAVLSDKEDSNKTLQPSKVSKGTKQSKVKDASAIKTSASTVDGDTKVRKSKAKDTEGLAVKSSDDCKEPPKKRTRHKGKKNAMDDNDLYFKDYKHAYEDPTWDGNEDDAGSVASGVMEEDFCFECGKSTLDADCWQNVIMCDSCDGEYHLQCLGLDKAPENEFICNRCLKERQHMDGLDFSVGDRFKIAPKPTDERKVVYSPSRPLESAWEECLRKGLMVVSEVFSYDLMRKLTHGVIENRTQSGRVVDIWRGATVEVPRRLSSSAFHNVVDREGRYDLKLPEFVVEELRLNEILEPILSKLRSVMGTPVPQIRTHNVVFVPVGSHSQQWHTDDSMKKHKAHRYFTVLIHLNSLDNLCGGTEVWSDERQLSDLIRCRPGDALVFNGSLLHRGQANLGYSHRFFYYASFACGGDMNVGNM